MAPPANAGPAADPGAGRRVAVLALVLTVGVVGGALLVLPLFSGQPFESAADLAPDAIRSVRVHVLNRGELDGGEDVGPYVAAPADYDRLLAPLRTVPEVPGFGNARGPWLGEYRVRTTTGRRGTIRLYWTRPPQPPSAAAAFGGTVGGLGLATAPAAGGFPPARLRFQIGPHLYEGGTAAAVIRAVEECADRGRK